MTPKGCAELVMAQPNESEIAILFGREHAGLTNEELLHCHCHLHIPSDPTFSSLNLAQAVQIIAYELRMAGLNPDALVTTTHNPPATTTEVELFYEHLEQVLIDIDFLKPSNPKRLLQRLRRMFNRAQLESTEVNILRGILTQVQTRRYDR